MNEILPVNRTKDEARRNYNRLSQFYDWLTASEKNLIRQGVNLLSVSSKECILEIGSGTGRGLKMFARQLSAGGVVVGVDLARKMLLKSRNKTSEMTPTPAFVQADGAHIPLKTNQFDAVFCSFTLELFTEEDIHTVLTEVKRVLKHGGRFGVVALAQKPRNLPVKLYEHMHQLFPVAVDCRPIPLKDLLVENDFTIKVAEKPMNWGLPIHVIVSTAP